MAIPIKSFVSYRLLSRESELGKKQTKKQTNKKSWRQKKKERKKESLAK